MTATLAPTLIRQDGRDKVTGSGRYAADLTMTGMLHGAFRIADIPHARIRRIDTTAARALPGVHAVITAADVPEVRYGAFLKDRTLFARDVVRWEGELVAAVAAATPEIAARAAALIEVDHEPLPAVTDLEAAVAPGCPARPRGLGDLRDRRERRPRRQRSLTLDDRQGRRRGRHGRRGHRRQGPLRRRWLARRADRAAGDRGRMAGRPRHDLVVHAGPVRGRGPASPRPSACRRTRSGSSCRTWAAASGRSASSASSRRSRPSRGPPAGRSRSSSRGARSSCCPTTAASAWSSSWRRASGRDGTIVARAGT